MTIIMEGHELKYELEATIKLFIPAEHFDFADSMTDSEEYIYTKISEQTEKTEFIVKIQCLGNQRGFLKDCAEQTILQEGICDFDTKERLLCRSVFDLLSEMRGYSPKWGVLTGVRPIRRLVKDMKSIDELDDAVKRFIQEDLVSEEKAQLAKRITEVQYPLLANLRKNLVSVYVAIPFCPTRCSYCSFVSQSVQSATKLIPAYVEALKKEIRILGETIDEYGLDIDTVYIGGGTPTSLDAEQLETLLSEIEQVLLHKGTEYERILREYTVEAGRPDTITAEKLRVLKQHSVTRISINPQTCNDEVLKVIGRKHTNQQMRDAYQLARVEGFDHINMDLIAGLPTDTAESFSHTLDEIMELNPESITVHCLTLKRSATMYRGGAQQLNSVADVMITEAENRLCAGEYRPYYIYRQKNSIENLENVGFAKKGYESLYNIYIMDETQSILGVGCGSSSKIVMPDKIVRIHNFKFPFEYVGQFERIEEKQLKIREALKEILQ